MFEIQMFHYIKMYNFFEKKRKKIYENDRKIERLSLLNEREHERKPSEN